MAAGKWLKMVLLSFVMGISIDPQHGSGTPLYRRGLRRLQVASWHACEKETEALGHGRVGEHGVA
jgi:hypothetical protein